MSKFYKILQVIVLVAISAHSGVYAASSTALTPDGQIYLHNGDKNGDTSKVSIKGNGEECNIFMHRNGQVVRTNCQKLKNSKNINILCTKSKKICKTEKEIFNALRGEIKGEHIQMPGVYKVSAIKLNVRDKPKIPSKIVGTINQGKEVNVHKFTNQWAKIDNGWISGKHLIYVNSNNAGSSDAEDNTIDAKWIILLLSIVIFLFLWRDTLGIGYIGIIGYSIILILAIRLFNIDFLYPVIIVMIGFISKLALVIYKKRMQTKRDREAEEERQRKAEEREEERRREAERERKEAERERKEAERERKEAAEREEERRRKAEEWREHLISKYTDVEIVDNIIRGEFWQGMTAEQLRDSKGRPDDLDEHVTKRKKVEYWKYGEIRKNSYRLVITLENDKIVAWKKQ